MEGTKLCTDNFNRRVRYLIESRGFSISEFAEYAQIAKQTMYNIIKGSHQPRLDTLILIAGALDMTLSELFIDEETNRNIHRTVDFLVWKQA